MRLASRAEDFWELRSGEQAHARNPATFEIPTAQVRNNLAVGQAARLIFDIEAVDESGAVRVTGERMWVIVADKVGDVYIGILDNQPACLDRGENVYLCFGAEIPFRAEHVIDEANPPPEHVKWQLSQLPERTWPRS